MEDSYIVEFIADNGCVVGEVIDTRGDLPTLMKKQFFKLLSHSDGFVLVFSIDNEDSFQYLKELCNDIQSYAYGNVPILIVSNKCDLEDNREVSTKVLSHLVDHIGCKLLNTSVRFSYVLCVCVCVLSISRTTMTQNSLVCIILFSPTLKCTVQSRRQ